MMAVSIRFRSLPCIVVSVTTTYHHHSQPFFDHMKNHKRERLFDPAPYLPGPLIGPLPQDGSNYLDELQWGFLSPGMRILNSSTSGVRLRRNAVERITVSNHGVLTEKEVFHPSELGVKIGDVEERYDKLDIAMVRLVPSKSSSYSNNVYFQGEPPRRTVTLDEVEANSYFEVEGMSTGLITMLFRGSSTELPLSLQDTHKFQLYIGNVTALWRSLELLIQSLLMVFAALQLLKSIVAMWRGFSTLRQGIMHSAQRWMT